MLETRMTNKISHNARSRPCGGDGLIVSELSLFTHNEAASAKEITGVAFYAMSDLFIVFLSVALPCASKLHLDLPVHRLYAEQRGGRMA